MSQQSIAEVDPRSEEAPSTPQEAVNPPFLHLKHVVACMDFSPASFAAMQVAERLCRQTRAHLSVLHVRGADLNTNDGIGAAEQARLQNEERGQVETILQGTLRHGVDAEAVVRIGQAAPCILAELASRHADLVVLGTHARGGLSRVLFGSTAEAVFRSASCAVVTVGPCSFWKTADDSRGPVVFATDFQDRSRTAARSAASLANTLETSLHCVHVLPLTVKNSSNPVLSLVVQEALEHLTHEGRFCAKSCRTDILYDSDVSHAIVDIAKSKRASAIVLGIQRKSILISHLPPHRTYRVVMNAPCPVFTFSFERAAPLASA